MNGLKKRKINLVKEKCHQPIIPELHQSLKRGVKFGMASACIQEAEITIHWNVRMEGDIKHSHKRLADPGK